MCNHYLALNGESTSVINELLVPPPFVCPSHCSPWECSFKSKYIDCIEKRATGGIDGGRGRGQHAEAKSYMEGEGERERNMDKAET
jgi:hypothetical protein